MTIAVLQAWREGKFEVIISQYLLEELEEVWQRPRLRARIDAQHARSLLEQLRWRGTLVAPTTVPPRCRDPRDHPVLAAAIDGRANAIVTGDADLRSDDRLRSDMAHYGVQVWGIDTFLASL